MRKIITSLVIVAGGTLMTMANNNEPLWLRNTAISPDGKNIAFTYMGDIFTVPTTGGEAKQITSNSAYDSYPVWSPDSKKIAFSSNRNGSMDIYIVDAVGGTPTRLTTHSANEKPLAFKDDNTIIFSGNIMPSAIAQNGYRFSQLYTVDIYGNRPALLYSMKSEALSIDKKGRILYQDKKGLENDFRKHERSSGTSDIWLIADNNGKPSFTKLTDFNGHDLNPVWNGDNSFLYVSEEDGTLNIYERSIDGNTKRQLTHFDTHPVRSLSVADNGVMAFSEDGQIYTLTPGGEPTKVNVSIIKDNNVKDPVAKEVSYGAENIALSPSGKEIALVIDGNIFVTSVEYGTTRQITSTPEQERYVEFTPDGRSLIYDSERNGKWQIFKASIKDEKEKNFTYATEITEELLVDPEHTAFFPRVSPDGKKVAFIDNRTAIKVIDLESKKINTALDGKYTYSYTDGDVMMTWSPDSKWLLIDGYIGIGGWNNSDVAAVKADGSELIDLTESGYSDSNCKWSKDGKAVIFMSDKNGYRSHGSWGAEYDAYIMFLDAEAYDEFRMTKEELALLKESKEKPETEKGDKEKKGKDKKDKKKEVKEEKKDFIPDFKYRKERMNRLTRNSSNMGDYYLTPEKDKLYYIARFEKGGDLWMIDLKEGETTLVKKDWGYGALMPDSTGKKLFSLSRTGIKSIDLGSKEVKNVSFEARYNYSPSAEREYMYEHMKSLINNKFHDVNLHGTDWEKYTAEYAKFLPHINNNTDFAELLSEVLGELNASHTGGGSYGIVPELANTAYLGAFYDESYDGDGLKIAEVIERGPIAVKTTTVKPGDIITHIDGEKILAGKDYFPLLAGKTNKRVRLTISHADGKTESVIVKPVSLGTNRTLLYKRWVDHNKAVVDSISNGKIGYVHINGMDSPSFRTIYDEILGKYRNCDAIVVDTRYNGGGWLHNDVALILSGKKYVDYAPRGQYIGSDPYSQWTKPSAMLVNESNYSDAHGTPYTYKTLGLGTLVGAPVPGTMTAVWWETQVNPYIYFGVPQVTSLDTNGNMLENQQLNPDVIIYNQPGDILNGVDQQLIGAVKLLMEQTKDKK